MGAIKAEKDNRRDKMEKYLDIGCLSNDAYAQHLGVTLYSLLENCSCPEKIKINVVDMGITGANKKKLNWIAKKFNSRINYLKPKPDLLNGIEISKRFGKETYYRFSLIETAKTSKLLSIDSDMIVKGDIAELFNLKFKDNVLFAVKDLDLPLRNRLKLGIKADTPYFNSGLLFIDLKKWKKQKLTEKALKWIKENADKTEFADQDGLNMALVGKWREIHPSWNMLTKIFYYDYPLPFVHNHNRQALETYKRIKQPKIIHYTGFLKPWFFFDPVPMKKEYLNYLKKTPWDGYKFPDLSAKAFLERAGKILGFFFAKFIKK